jgi:ComF family protein
LFSSLSRFAFELACRKCLLCSEINQLPSSLCISCWNKFRIIDDGSLFSYGRGDYSVVAYNDVAREVVHGFKYYDDHTYIGIMVKLMWQYIELNEIEFDYIIPVPMSRKKLFLKGFNHTAILAKELKRYSGKRVEFSLLRKKDSRSQAMLSVDARIKNIRGKVFVDKRVGVEKNARLLLLDDVVTTRATIDECRRVLGRDGYGDVVSLSFARVFR